VNTAGAKPVTADPHYGLFMDMLGTRGKLNEGRRRNAILVVQLVPSFKDRDFKRNTERTAAFIREVKRRIPTIPKTENDNDEPGLVHVVHLSLDAHTSVSQLRKQKRALFMGFNILGGHVMSLRTLPAAPAPPTSDCRKDKPSSSKKCTIQ
jgi:hypothetical protein